MLIEESCKRVSKVVVILHLVPALESHCYWLEWCLAHELGFHPVIDLGLEVFLNLVERLEVRVPDLKFDSLQLLGDQVLLLLFIGLLLVDQLLEDEEVLKEVVLVAVDGKHFEDADHFVVLLDDHIVEERGIVVPDEPVEGVLGQDLMLVLNDRVNLILIGIGAALVGVIADLEADVVGVVGLVFRLRGVLAEVGLRPLS